VGVTKVEKTLNAMQGVQAVVTKSNSYYLDGKPIQTMHFKNCFQLRVITRSRFSIQMMLYYQQKNHSTQKNAAGKYYCPMFCEDDKVYDEAGDCPVCGMDLQAPDLTPANNVHPCILKLSRKGRAPPAAEWI
jgi:Cu2+-exporting ATPase